MKSLDQVQQIRQHPFLSLLLRSPLQPTTPNKKAQNSTSWSCSVATADVELLCREGCNFGLESEPDMQSCAMSRFGFNTSEVARQGEYLAVIESNSHVRHLLVWPQLPLGLRDTQTIYPWQALSLEYNRDSNCEDSLESISHLVWIRVQTVHTLKRAQESSPFGTFLRRTVEYTIYNPPAEGFGALYKQARKRTHSPC